MSRRFPGFGVPALLLLLSFLLPASISASLWVVHPDGSGDAPTIQAAIDSIQSEGVVELADGVFTGFGNRDLNNMEKAIVVRSISGDPAACIIDCDGSPTDPHWFIGFSGGG